MGEVVGKPVVGVTDGARDGRTEGVEVVGMTVGA